MNECVHKSRREQRSRPGGEDRAFQERSENCAARGNQRQREMEIIFGEVPKRTRTKSL